MSVAEILNREEDHSSLEMTPASSTNQRSAQHSATSESHSLPDRSNALPDDNFIQAAISFVKALRSAAKIIAPAVLSCAVVGGVAGAIIGGISALIIHILKEVYKREERN